MGLLDSVHLSHVLLLEGLDLGRWALLLHGLNEVGESHELIGMNESLGLSLELLYIAGCLHRVVKLYGLSLGVLSLSLNRSSFFFRDLDGVEFSSVLHLLHRGGGDDGGDSGDSGEFEHLF